MTSNSLSELAQTVSGDVISPDHAEYEAARRLWNGAIDKRPAVIVRCAGVADVIDAVNFARRENLAVSIRGGGHHVAGGASNDGGLVIDLSRMRSVRVDPESKTARAEGGALIVDVDRACMPFNLAVPLGVFSETGIAGITLGGGVGWLRRSFGMTCDSLISADVVTSEGELIKASATQNPDLFWALRGGGWDFGVVTSFEYQTYDIDTEMAFLFVTYPIEEATDVLSRFADFMQTCPDAFSPLAVLWSFPADEAYPPEVWGKQFVGLAGPYCGRPEDGERLFQPLRELGTILLDMTGTMSYYDVQHLFDHEYPVGRRYYWKSSYLTDMTPDAIRTVVEAGMNRPSSLSSVDIWTLGGAISRVAASDTPISQREAPFMIGIEANWDDPHDDAANIAWTRGLAGALKPFSTGASYLNFEDLSEADFTEASHGANFERLAALKQTWDPGNVFKSRKGLVR